MTDETIDQPAAESITDRIASKFGFPGQPPGTEEAAETADAQAEPAEDGLDLAELEWEGIRFKAPAKVKEALLRQDDYTRKTQELAESRRSVEHIQKLAQQSQLDRVFSDSIAAEQQELGVIDAYLQQATRMDWSTMTTEQMLRHKVEVDSIKERRDAIRSAIADKRSQFDTEVKSKISELRKSAWDMAVKKIGGSSEETQKAVTEYGLSKGLTEQELSNVLLDPRSAEILWEAAQFRKIKAGTSQAAEKATKASPVLKPGAAGERMPAKTAAQLNFQKAMKGARTSGEKANIIEQRLSGIFAK
jgi:hypothetical protein